MTGFDLDLDEDQRRILDAAGAMLDAHYPVSRRRGGEREDLGELAAFGLFSLALVQADADAGLSLVEEALLHVLLGRHLVSTGALATSLGARLAAASGMDDLAGRIAALEARLCAAIPSRDGTTLLERGDASLALVLAGRELLLLDLDATATRTVEALGHGAPAERLAAGQGRELARSSDPRLLGVADLLVSAQLLGAAQTARDLAVAYATVREQFGQPIGGFQAVKHHCADMAVACELASAQLDFAAIAMRDETAEAGFQIAALRHLAAEAAFFCARTSIQVHGGIGFSAEADVHLCLKQAHMLSRLGHGDDILALEAPLRPHAAPSHGA